MVDVFERIKEKKIVIWGIGALQEDLEGIYSFSNCIYYVDDKVRIAEKMIFSPEKLAEENKNNIVVIICAENQSDIIAALKEMGYERENYILVQEFFLNSELFQQMCSREILIWGTGNTYLNYENEVKRYIGEISGFVVTEKKEEEFQGKKIYLIEEVKNRAIKPFIIVSSIYYREIYDSLKKIGMKPGSDFIYIKSFVSFGRCVTGIYGEYCFESRKKESKNLIIVLAGYKKLIWEGVFSRLCKYAPEDADVCIVTSGLFNQDLKDMCSMLGWSYLSTLKNNVSFVVNLAIYLHPKAEYIYKMDEDIFVTDGIFEGMKTTYQQVEEKSRYEVGFVAPLIPVNGYGHVRLLEIFDEVERWEEQFGKLKYTDCHWHHRSISKNPKSAQFMWGEENPGMDNLDKMQKILSQRTFQYSVCPIRYSIGLILFQRDTWLQMETFQVLEYGNIGVDEEWICQFCMMQGRAMVIAENTIAGHLSYGEQNKDMEEYYNSHKEKFLLSLV